MESSKVATIDSINPYLLTMDLQVRDWNSVEEVVGDSSPPPTVHCDGVDMQAGGQKPITFLRQVLALCAYTKLFDDPSIPDDAKEKATRMLNSLPGRNIGSYTDQYGVEIVRHDVADYITRRDGSQYPCNVDDIFMTTGSIDGIETMFKCLMTELDYPNQTGILMPVPCPKNFPALVTEMNGVVIPYYLEESNGWQLEIEELESAVKEARSRCLPRGLLIVNPGNPTGQILSREKIEEVIKFANRENLFIIADEIYQENIYGESAPFHSFKKVFMSMGGSFENTQIASFMSISAGYVGECGYRCGSCEVVNLDPVVRYNLLKYHTSKTEMPVIAQLAMGVVMNPPTPGDASYRLFKKEKSEILGGLSRRIHAAVEFLNGIEGVRCHQVQGSIFVFPRVFLPERAIREAENTGTLPDVMYCSKLLKQTGLSVVPGSELGLRGDSHHFRMSLLSKTNIDWILQKFEQFHQKFMSEYR